MKTPSLRWIVDRNPFYLLSACSGLSGCWLLGDVSRPDLADAIMKTGTVFAYEIAVVALAVWLARRAGMQRDAAILSVLTVVLIADVAFFYTQSAMLAPGTAKLFAVFGAAQSVAIAGILLRGIRVGLSKVAEWLIAIDLTVLHLMPVALRLSAEDFAGLQAAFWIAFLAVGTIVATHALPRRWRVVADRTEERLPQTLAVVTPAVILGSLLAHVIAAQWIYDVALFSVFLSPVLLGYAAIGLRCESRFEGQAFLFRPGGWACLFSVWAALFAFGRVPEGAVWDAAGWSWFGLSPLRFMLAGTAVVCWIQWRMRRGVVPFAVACSAFILAVLGHTQETMAQHVRWLWLIAVRLGNLAFPETRAGWGVVLFCAAFLLLALGAAASRSRVRMSGDDPC